MSNLVVPSLLTMYRPRKPVAPNTVAVWPPRADLPPCVRIIGFPVRVIAMSEMVRVYGWNLLMGAAKAILEPAVRLGEAQSLYMLPAEN